MGILKNTKAGKSAIRISEEYLLDKGWFVKNGLIYPPSEIGKLSHGRYMRFNVIVEDGKQIKLFYVIFKKGSSLKYEIKISTIDDLELLDKFWNSKGRDKIKYRDKLFSRGKEMEHLWFNFTPTYCKPKEYTFNIKLKPVTK